MFGGIDQEGNILSDLQVIEPNFEKNKKILNSTKGDYKRLVTPKLFYSSRKLEPAGKPPCPRYQHASCIFGNKLVIHGGRNDKEYSKIKNVALNDLHILDLSQMMWMQIGIYGESIPESRWGHGMTADTTQ